MKSNRKTQQKKVILVGISSDIGLALADRWMGKGWRIFGTYLTPSAGINSLKKRGAKLVKCDMSDNKSVARAAKKLRESVMRWDVLVLLPATQEPVGLFADINMKEWRRSIEVNFTSHYHLLHDLLPFRNRAQGKNATVIFFAGGGTNNATVRYSAYTIAKIAQIKMCELLDAEVSDTKFTILGPGWVRTKIHQATIKAGRMAGNNYMKTLQKLKSSELTPMERVVDCCDWVIAAPRAEVGGRNFSVVSDAWGAPELGRALRQDENLYKLRRFGNEQNFT